MLEVLDVDGAAVDAGRDRQVLARCSRTLARCHATPPPSVILSAAEAAVVAPSRDSADTVREEPTCRSSARSAELERVFGAAMLNPQHGGMMSYVLAASAVGDLPLPASITKDLFYERFLKELTAKRKRRDLRLVDSDSYNLIEIEIDTTDDWLVCFGKQTIPKYESFNGAN